MPHPVLSPVGRDYADQFTFQGTVANVRADEEDDRIIIAVQYELNEPTLNGLVRQGKAQFTTTTDCTPARSRETHSTGEDRQEIVLDARKYTGGVQVQSLITARQDIPGFHSPSWTPELRSFLRGGIHIPEGAFLAVSQPWNIRLDDAEPLESCVVIIPQAEIQEGTFDISLEGDSIAIMVSEQDKARIDRTRQGQGERYLWPSIYLSAIELAVRKHQEEEWREKNWARVVREQVDRAGIDTSDQDAFQARSLLHAQKLLENPMRHLIGEED